MAIRSGGSGLVRGLGLASAAGLAVFVGHGSLLSSVWAEPLASPVLAQRTGVAPEITSQSSPAVVALAKHLSRQGVVLYVAYWCPHCHEQKELFGRQATSELTIVECAPDGLNSQPALCERKRVEGYPSWEINGTLDAGVQSLANLARLSGFRGSGSF
ncbi:MAG: hypothetical protein VKK03_06830 [Synechococcus sp.]|nr:hypothetical protein [Synechococcus sp.]